MDFSFLVLIPLAALISAMWIIGAAVLSAREPTFRWPFLISYGLGVLFMQPWLIQSWSDAGMFGAMLVMLAFWTTAGWIIGAVAAMLLVALTRRMFRRKPSSLAD